MKIAILGTRGIPNNYGGFEECAEHISKWLVQKGHEVTVYNPDYHPYQFESWEGVRLVKVFSREDRLGPFGNLIYEFLSFRHALKADFDVILELGTQFALFRSFFGRTHTKIITNVDGLETRRDKWSSIQKWIIKKSEVNAVTMSDVVVADNPIIKEHVDRLYPSAASVYIGYGANIGENPNEEITRTWLDEFGVSSRRYCLLIARIEPENNVKMIIDGFIKAGIDMPLLVVGPIKSKYAKSIRGAYEGNSLIKFLGGIYGKKEGLDILRRHALIYFHGHSVGGTNPALLQAMAQDARIFAHDNAFNRYVLGNNAIFFESHEDLAMKITKFDPLQLEKWSRANKERLLTEFGWDLISKSYLDLFESLRSL